MIMTMAEEFRHQGELFPNPERLEKVMPYKLFVRHYLNMHYSSRQIQYRVCLQRNVKMWHHNSLMRNRMM